MRYILSSLSLLCICASTLFSQAGAVVWTSSDQPMHEIALLRKAIKAPVFAAREFRVTDFGGKGDGVSMNTEALRKVIEACSKSGGGKVVVPAGRFLTGPVHLLSNVNLHLEKDAVLVFSRNPDDYPLVLTRWEGMDCMNYSPQIYAFRQKNIAVTGTGTIDGNADTAHWWPWKGNTEHGWKKGMQNQKADRDTLHSMMKQRIAPQQRIFGKGHYLRPYMLQTYECSNVLISGVTMINSPMWFVSPAMCDNVTIEKLTIRSHGPNTDGCDPEACRNVWIKDCFFDTGDDCIAIKSGRDEDGRAYGRPAENHLIENCEMKDGHGGVVIGSEIAGGARNIYAINCIMNSPNLDRVLRIKTSSARGGTIENIFLKNIQVGRYKESAIHCNMFYENPGNYIPVIRNIRVENLTVTEGGEYAVWIHAYPNSPVQHLTLVNCSFNGISKPLLADHVRDMDFKQVTINGQPFPVPDSLQRKQ